MAYCPQCQAEYEDDVKRCHDCDVELLEGALPEEDDGKWVVVTTVAKDVEASIIEGFFEAEEIPVLVENIRSHPLPETFGDLSEIRIKVPRERKDEAERILRKREEDFKAAGDDDEAVLTDDGMAHLDDDLE